MGGFFTFDPGNKNSIELKWMSDSLPESVYVTYLGPF
jgi:hypothetical protein